MIGVFLGSDRIGTVIRFAGNRSSERFVAYSVHDGEQRRFALQRLAIAWLGERHRAAGALA